MSRFWVANKQYQDHTEAVPIPHQLSQGKTVGKKLDSQRFQSSAGTTVVVDIIEPDNTAPDNSSEEGGEDYEEAAVPLTIKATSEPESRTDDSFEGTEITMAPPRKLDKYGFILNIDERGMVYESAITPNGSTSGAAALVETRKTASRERKWNASLDAWERRRPKKIKERLRKGIPDSLRGRVWLALGGGIREPGLYQKIVQETSDAMLDSCKAVASQIISVAQNGLSTSPANNGREESTGATTTTTISSSECSFPTSGLNGSPDTQQTISAHAKKQSPSNRQSKSPSADPDDYAHSKAFRMVQETIERDLHRTYPRHSLFFEDETARDDEAITNAASSVLGLSGVCDPELASLVLNLERDIKTITTKGATSKPLVISPSSSTSSDKLTSPNGQAALRRVLRAYSYYDREISYCQGMNFIAGMFLTVMSEEEAFWLLVDVMHEKPCEMRGMFGEGMRETHKVLFVAERLTHMHLPKLARHFDRENIHVTMYATQWLLTQYTSSFKFDLVTRVWDAFLGEGWKVIYRVMLALLQQWQSRLLKMSFEEILAFFRELPDRVNGNSVMETAIKINLKTRQIVRLEKEWHDKQQ